MKIEIAIEQGTRNKERVIIVEDITMLSRNELPSEYIHGGESVMKYSNMIYYFNDNHAFVDEFMEINNWYYEDHFMEKIETIKRCAKRLSGINKKLDKELVDGGWRTVKKKIYI